MSNSIKVIFTLLVVINKISFAQFDLNINTQQMSSSPTRTFAQTIATPSPTDLPNNKINDQVTSIVETVEQNENYIDLGNLSPDSNIALPAGIIKDVGAVRYVIAIDSLKFKSTDAYLSAYAAISFPGTTQKLAFRGSNIKFNPSGVMSGDQARLYLASTHVIQINPHVRLRLKGNGQNWVEWDCNGFKAINLVGNFEFHKGKLLPDPEDNPNKDTVVTATFQIYTQNIHEFIISANFTPFVVESLPGWSFKVTNAVIDMSELANAPGMSFPPGYANPNLNPVQLSTENGSLQSENLNTSSNQNNNPVPLNQTTSVLWRGFYLQSLRVKLPPEISKSNQRTEINVNNLLIDNMGITGLFEVSPLFSLGEGSMSGWGFSVDKLRAVFLRNRLVGGGLSGKINLPVDQVKALNYEAMMQQNLNEKRIDYFFAIKPAEDMNFDVFGAKLNINNNSALLVKSEQGKFKPRAVLNGYIGFDTPKFNSGNGKLTFQDLVLETNAPYVTNGLFSLNLSNEAKFKIKNFSISLSEIYLGVTNGNPSLGAGVLLSLTEKEAYEIGLGTSVIVRGKFTPQINSGNIGRLELDRVIVNGINISFKQGPFELQGSLNYRDDHPVYGDGIFGNVQFSIPDVISNPVGVGVGFGNTGTYKYFYVDTKIPGPIPLGSSPFVITNIVGGVYHHMQPNVRTVNDYINTSVNFTSSGPLNYVPSPTVALGIKLGTSMIMTTGQFKGDALLEMNFNSNGGINEVALKGNVYGVAGSIPITGNMLLNYNVPTKTFDGLFAVNATYYAILNGNGYLKIHSEPSYWNICAGTPSQPMSIRLLNLVSANGYIMTGKNLEPPATPSIQAQRTEAALNNGQGLVIGSFIRSNINRSLNLGIFTLVPDINFFLGFDVMIRNYGQNATCSGTTNKVGINGKQIEGNMYLDMDANLKIRGQFKFTPNCPSSYQTHLLCCHGCLVNVNACVNVNLPCLFNESFDYTIFNSKIYMSVNAKMPNPIYFAGRVTKPYNYFGGRLSGNVEYDFSYGNDCTIVPN
ncbi:MAG: hypothetical protein ACK50A_05545 [Sphingobacteriaceae bacterium]